MTQRTTYHGRRLDHPPATPCPASTRSSGTRVVTRLVLRTTLEHYTTTQRKQLNWCCCVTIVILIGTAWAIPQSPEVQSPEVQSPDSPRRASPASLTEQLLDDAPPQPNGAAREVPGPSRLSHPYPGAGSDTGENAPLLTRVGRRMQAVAARLRPASVLHETQQMQKDILTDLEQLLRHTGPNLTRQGNTQPGQGVPSALSRQQQQPSNDDAKPDSRNAVSQDDLDPSESQPRAASHKQLWGSLPKQVRDRLRNIFNEQVVPKYQPLVDAYYERLSTTPQETTPGTTD